MEKDNNKLPIALKNNFITKLKKAIFILLSSVGLASNITASTYAKTGKQVVEVDYKKQKDNFKDSLKADFSSQNKKIIQEILNGREEKGLGKYSQDTGAHDNVENLLLEMLDMLDKNFEMNASKRGKLAVTKEEYKNEIISLIKNLDDIVCVDENGPKNQYTEYFKERRKASAIYVFDDIKNDLGVIKGNKIIYKEGYIKHLGHLSEDIYILVHEISHSKQGKIDENSLYAQNKNVIKMLREGHSNNKAEYIRECIIAGQIDEYNANEPAKLSLTFYDLSTILYNKLAYFLGEKKWIIICKLKM